LPDGAATGRSGTLPGTVTRESIPQFDLYAELEVDSSASVATIEFAYRKLAKRHHPDIGGSGDERIKRINLSRDWLTDSERRRRYDRSLVRPPITMTTATDARRARGGRVYPEGSQAAAESSYWATYGPNDADVRQFLTDLREIDYARAREVSGGTRAAFAAGHQMARSAAFRAGRLGRLSEWLYARDAAAIIVRTRLGEALVANEIVEAMADAAGAIAVRDLISRTDFELLLLPWTWRGDHILERPAASAAFAGVPNLAPVAAATGAARAAAVGMARGFGVRTLQARPSAGMLGIWAGTLGLIVAFVAVGAALINLGPGHIAVVAGLTDNPGASSPSPVSPTLPPLPSVPVPTPAITPPITAIDPAQLHAMQLAASKVIDRLTFDASIGAVTSAQALLGSSAPGLRASGLVRATFPNVTPTDIVIARTGSTFVATVGTDTMTSKDGSHWLFNYGNRPLARYTLAATRHLYFLGPSGDTRQVDVRMGSVTITRSAVVVALTWTYGSSSVYANDGPYFVGDRLVVSGLTIGSRSIPIANGFVANLGTSALKGSVHIAGTKLVPGTVVVDIAVIGSALGEIDASFALGS